MTERGVVIVGAGHAGVQVATSLRELGYPGPVTLLSKDVEQPYERPPLSKAWLKGQAVFSDLEFRRAGVYQQDDINLRTAVEVLAIDRQERCVHTTEGRVAYDHLVLATGARPRPLPVPGHDLGGVHHLHTYSDATALLDHFGSARDVVVVGGGFIGLEVAAAARAKGLEVHVLEAMDRVMQRAVSPTTSEFYESLHSEAGTTVQCRASAVALVGEDGHVAGVQLSDGSTLPADLVVAGIGVIPSVELASGAGLECANGIVVDATLRTSDPHISAIGDCASFPLADGSRLRLESVQNAVDQARTVAARLTGAQVSYDEVPWFWTDQLGCKLQMAGLTADSDERVLVGDQVGRKFSVLCWRNGRLVGGESVNRPGDHITLRRMLAQGLLDLTPEDASAEDFDLKAYLKNRTPARA